MFELLESFCKQIVPLLTEHDDVIETQTKNCMRSQIAHATPLVNTVSSALIDSLHRRVRRHIKSDDNLWQLLSARVAFPQS